MSSFVRALCYNKQLGSKPTLRNPAANQEKMAG